MSEVVRTSPHWGRGCCSACTMHQGKDWCFVLPAFGLGPLVRRAAALAGLTSLCKYICRCSVCCAYSAGVEPICASAMVPESLGVMCSGHAGYRLAEHSALALWRVQL